MSEDSSTAERLRVATQRFIELCRRASSPEWNLRPAPQSWSMGDVAEHVSIANQGILRRLSTALASSPLDGRRPDITDEEIPYLFYRGDEPPNIATPTGLWTSWDAVEATFQKSAAGLIEWAQGVTLEPRAHGVAHPVFGLMDGTQWLLFAAAHTERHRAQLIGLMRHAAR